MITTPWNRNINCRFYNFSDKPKDNVKVTEMASGRTIGYQINTRAVVQISCSVRLRVRDELPLFWQWYCDTLGGTAGTFTCESLPGKTYRFSAVPEPADTGRLFRVLSLELEEVY